MINKKLFALVTLPLLALLSLALSACAPQVVEGKALGLRERPIRVTTTTGMISDIVTNIGGERVQVVGLMGPGVDPHLYKASEGDLHELEKADVIFYSGLHLEAGLARIFEHMVKWKRIVAVTDPINRARLNAPPEFKGNYDPHVWFDVRMWMQAAGQVRDTLVEMDPDSAALYQANAQRYLAQLEELDAYIHQQAERLPKEQRVLVTAHDAFNYFGRAYGFEVRGLQGISTASEAGTGDVQKLADEIARRKIRAIFVESSVPRRNVEAVQAAVRARGFEVIIGGTLFSDAMGSPGTPEGTYIGMVRHNINTIVGALLGEQ